MPSPSTWTPEEAARLRRVHARPEPCTFLTVPDEDVTGPGRLVACDRPESRHPVTGEGRFVNHRLFLPRRRRGPA